MKKLFIINDNLENKTSYYLLAAFLMALPFDRFFCEWLLIVFCFHTLIHLKIEKLKKLGNKNVWVVGSIFFLGIAAITFSSYKSEGLKDSMQQLGIILFPVFLSITNLNIGKYKWFFLELFGVTCTVTILYLYFESFKIIHYFHLPVLSIFSRSFINQDFTAPIGLHATYFSMYVLLSVCIFLFLFYLEPEYKNGKFIFYLLILLAGLVQLSSRAVFIATEIIIVFIIPLFLLHGKRKVMFFLIALFSSALFFLIITQVDTLKKRYINDLENDLSEYTDPGDHSESRMLRWNLEWELIQKSPIVGYGAGSEKYILEEKYFENKFYRSYLAELNAHNQFLSFLINTGIIGLFLYLYVLYYGFAYSIKRKDFLLLSFMTILAVVSISENILDVNKGVFFYAFFYSFFLLNTSKENTRAAT